MPLSSTNKENLKKFGSFIEQYLDKNFPTTSTTNSERYLVIDDELFQEIYEKSGLKEETILAALKEAKCNYEDNEYIALAIASFQVKILYDLNFNKENFNEDAYNRKISNTLKFDEKDEKIYKYYNPQSSKYISDQENLWDTIKKKFKIIIPEKKNYSNRFVQYPRHQKIIDGTIRSFLISWADKFKSNLPLSNDYELFCNKLELKDNSPENQIKNHLIFNFYKSWNGESTEEYKKHHEYSIRNRKSEDINETEVDDEYYVNITTDENVVFYKNKQPTTEIEQIISKIEGRPFLFTEYGGNPEWWEKYNKQSDINRAYLLTIYSLQDLNQNNCLANAKKEYENERIKIYIKDFSVLIRFKYNSIDLPIKNIDSNICKYDQFAELINEKIIAKINSYLKEKTKSIEFLGGIKVKGLQKTWYNFALPFICVHENITQFSIDGSSCSQFINKFSDYKLQEEEKYVKILQLTSDMLNGIGKHSITINGNTENIFMENICNEKISWQITGTKVKKDKLLLSDTDDKKDFQNSFSINGYEIKNLPEVITRIPQNKSQVSKLSKIFQIDLKYFIKKDSKQYNKMDNLKIEKWRKYGNR